jgi:ribosomal protein S18 acetylase RimI-like enzyme
MGSSRVEDSGRIRALLESDRPWAAYALADLSPGFWEHCQWFVREGSPPALVMLYCRLDPPVIFALGTPERLAPKVQEIQSPVLLLHVRPEALAAIETCYQVVESRPQWRMTLEPERFRPVPSGDASPLGTGDVEAIRALFADGEPRGEAPDFFDDGMVAQGLFRGVFEGAELVAVAGTHVVAPEEGVCAMGNVYVRHDRRGRGLGAIVTSAVAADALADGLRTVALNVSQGNRAALRLYERLGFRRYCAFVAGRAVRS